jgi:hypothetical protein
LFAAGVVDTGGNLPPAVPTTLMKLVAKFAAVVVDTGDKKSRDTVPLTLFYTRRLGIVVLHVMVP